MRERKFDGISFEGMAFPALHEEEAPPGMFAYKEQLRMTDVAAAVETLASRRAAVELKLDIAATDPSKVIGMQVSRFVRTIASSSSPIVTLPFYCHSDISHGAKSDNQLA